MAKTDVVDDNNIVNFVAFPMSEGGIISVDQMDVGAQKPAEEGSAIGVTCPGLISPKCAMDGIKNPSKNDT